MRLAHALRSVIFLSLLFSHVTVAATLNLLVLTHDKQVAENIGVSFVPKFTLPEKYQNKPPQSQTMDQQNTQFVPHILMAQKGAPISFPNSDSVQHHVYSFSEAKTFELKLYKDQKPEPLPFETEGTVTLGCNIHDWMLGYVFVVDTPFFGKTDQSGLLKVDLPAGQYDVFIHSPLLQKTDLEFKQTLTVSNQNKQSVSLTLTQPLLPGLNEFDDVDEFDAY